MKASVGLPRLRRHVADLLSLANFALGAVAVTLALDGRYVLGLLCIALGALCDGLDGAAARRWGGTRCGVLADDVADAVTYGVAPAVALWTFLGGPEGLAVGIGYAAFTLTRLVHFTLDKANGDPKYFRGVPSTLAGFTVLCAVVAWGRHPTLVALAVGAVSVKMVTFSARYRHLGRWFTQLSLRPKIVLAVAALALVPWIVLAPISATSTLLVGMGGYLLYPSAKEFARSLTRARG